MRHTLSNHSAQAIRFGPFELDVKNCQLRRNGVRVPLQKQPCKVLICLVSNPGLLVPREELKKQVWGDRTHVNFDAGLNFCMRQIRRVLGESASQPRLLETESRRGYRFIGSVESVVSAPMVDNTLEHFSIKVAICCSEDLRDCQILARLSEGIAALLFSYQPNAIPRNGTIAGEQARQCSEYKVLLNSGTQRQ